MLALLMDVHAAAQPRASDSFVDTRRIELTAEASGQAHEVRIVTGLATAFVFHGAVIDRDRVTLEGRERMRVAISEDTLLIIPSERVATGERLRLTVPFKDTAVPASTTFVLVANPASAERQVEVYRQPRSAESLRVEVKEKDVQLQRCHEQVGRLQAGQKNPPGLVGLLLTRQMDETGVRLKDIRRDITQQSGGALKVWQARSFRSSGLALVELWLRNRGTVPWAADRAVLLGRTGGELEVPTVWLSAPSAPGSDTTRVLVQVEATEEEARGPFTLTLWEEETGLALILGNVTFP